MLGLLSVINTNDPDLTSLSLGIDLTIVGLSLSSTDSLYKTFGSPWSDELAKGELEYCSPTCYYAKTPPPLHVSFYVVVLFADMNGVLEEYMIYQICYCGYSNYISLKFSYQPCFM